MSTPFTTKDRAFLRAIKIAVDGMDISSDDHAFIRAECERARQADWLARATEAERALTEAERQRRGR